jgi:hypothetical protein
MEPPLPPNSKQMNHQQIHPMEKSQAFQLLRTALQPVLLKAAKNLKKKTTH